MDFRLQPTTDAGRRFVGLAESHAADFATRAQEHDREATFPHENIAAMKASGFTSACVPVELGGLGLTSVHDLATGISRLGAGDSSTCIGIAMHFLMTWVMGRRWTLTPAEQRPAESLLREAGAGRLIFAAINSENGSDPRHPFTEATRVEGGWRVNGRKSFGTMSPAADFYSCAVMVQEADGSRRLATALVHRDTPGMRIDPTWDAFGMRASGSDEIVFEGCFLPEGAVSLGQKWGTFGAALSGGIVGGVALTSVFLGIAECAYGHAVDAAMTRKRRRETPMREVPAVQLAVAEMDIALGSCRAVLGRAGRLVDETLARDPSLAEQQQLMKEVQAAKHYLNRAAIQVVDQALALSGGSGYLNKSPLSRLYRDVRAGPFMSPLTAGDGIEYVGKVALGFDPDEG